MFIFFDESGDIHGDKNGYFIVGGFITGDPRRTSRAFRKWQHTKFPRKLRHKTEVKFSDTGMEEKLREQTLAYFIRQDIRIFYAFLKAVNIPPRFRKKQHLESGLLYAEIVTQALNLLLPTSDIEFRVYRDERQLKRVPQAQFNEIVERGIAPNLPAKALLSIKAIDSASDVNIQIADWICGALFQHHAGTDRGNRYMAIMKNSIIASNELFKDFWAEFERNKKSPHEG